MEKECSKVDEVCEENNSKACFNISSNLPVIEKKIDTTGKWWFSIKIVFSLIVLSSVNSIYNVHANWRNIIEEKCAFAIYLFLAFFQPTQKIKVNRDLSNNPRKWQKFGRNLAEIVFCRNCDMPSNNAYWKSLWNWGWGSWRKIQHQDWFVPL